MDVDIDVIQRLKNAHIQCNLAVLESERIVNRLIDSGIFIETRRWIRKQFMISKAHPKTSVYYKSSSSRRKEESRHLNNYYFIIHPFSIFKLYWESMMFFVFVYMLILYSLDDIFKFSSEYLFYIHVLKFLGDLIYSADICQSFAAGYYDTQISKSILSPSKIAKSYLLSYFIIDFIAIIPSVFIPLEWMNLINRTSFPAVEYVRFAGVIRLLRMSRWFDTLEVISAYRNYSTYIHKTLFIILVYAVSLCVLYFLMFACYGNMKHIGNEPIRSIQDRYLTATLILMVSAHGTKKLSTELAYLIVVAVFLIAGFVLYLYLYAHLLEAWNTFIKSSTATSNVVQQIERFMQYKGLPIQLREKIIVFFDFKFQHDFYHEKRIQYIITDLLRHRIVMNLIKNNVAGNSLFFNLPSFVMYRVVAKMKSCIYLEDDVIMQAGDFNDTVYFIFHGALAVYSIRGIEICHLEDGAVFGQLCLLTEKRKVVTIVAVNPTEIYQVSKSDLQAILEEFPDIERIIIRDCFERFIESKAGYF